MSLTIAISYSITIALLLILLKYEFCRNLMMFQQNSYRIERYRRWFTQSGETTSFPNLIAILLFLLGLTSFHIRNFAVVGIGLFALIIILRLSRKQYKKPLVITKRVTRLILAMSLITIFVIGLSLAGFLITTDAGPSTLLFVAVETMLLSYILVRFIVILAAFITRPIENHINKGFYKDAVSRLQSVPGLKIIGITGSYGKTSTKHYLNQILSEQYETLMTPGSFNTTLGVIRTIRENLKPYHEVFIVEMGAKQTGDIKEIAELVKPEIGIVTAVGPQHLETFKTIENVRDTKFELVDSLPAEGIAVINNNYPIIAERSVTNCICLRYCVGNNTPESDIRAENIEYFSGGTRFTIKTKDGKNLNLETVLLGDYNIANLTAAVAVALSLGVSEDKIKLGVARIQPVEHRLSMKKLGNGLTIIDDAFNSNPSGAAMAVEVLSRMNEGRRIIITPGMIELGEMQAELNKNFGKQIAESNIDLALIVGKYNREAILEGLNEGKMKEDQIMTFDSFLEAYNYLMSHSMKGDTVLIENDLPDTFK